MGKMGQTNRWINVESIDFQSAFVAMSRDRRHSGLNYFLPPEN